MSNRPAHSKGHRALCHATHEHLLRPSGLHGGRRRHFWLLRWGGRGRLRSPGACCCCRAWACRRRGCAKRRASVRSPTCAGRFSRLFLSAAMASGAHVASSGRQRPAEDMWRSVRRRDVHAGGKAYGHCAVPLRAASWQFQLRSQPSQSHRAPRRPRSKRLPAWAARSAERPKKSRTCGRQKASRFGKLLYRGLPPGGVYHAPRSTLHR